MRTLARLKSGIAARLETLAELGGLALSISGAGLALVLGKLVVGFVLGALALGFLLRLKGRSHGAAPAKLPLPAWVRPIAALASVVEIAVLVEATNLPVRFSQEGFQYGHWYLLALAFVALYFLQTGALASVLRRRATTDAA